MPRPRCHPQRGSLAPNSGALRPAGTARTLVQRGFVRQVHRRIGRSVLVPFVDRLWLGGRQTGERHLVLGTHIKMLTVTMLQNEAVLVTAVALL